MKTLLAASAITLILTATGATALAHERYDGDYWTSRHRLEASRHAMPEVLYDRYGNKVIFSHGERYVIPVEEPCHRAPVIVVPECRHAPAHFEPPFIGPLKFIFPR